jgi:hypothetical protein
MHLFLPKSKLNIAYPAFMRQAGYTYITNHKTGQGSFVKTFGRNNYPRFHVYVIEEGDKIIFNAHLDQKQASYEGVSAHSGEYDGPLVKEELERLKSLLGIGDINRGYFSHKKVKEIDASQESKAKRWSDLIKGN